MENFIYYENEKISVEDFKNGNWYFRKNTLYIIISSDPEIQQVIFKKMEKVSFINSPSKEAIKIPHYIERIGEEVNDTVKIINSLNYINKGVNIFGLFDRITIVIFREIKTSDSLIVETSGLDNRSIIKLMYFCDRLIKDFENKTIVLVENNLYHKKNPNSFLFMLNEEKIKTIERNGKKEFF